MHLKMSFGILRPFFSRGGVGWWVKRDMRYILYPISCYIPDTRKSDLFAIHCLSLHIENIHKLVRDILQVAWYRMMDSVDNTILIYCLQADSERQAFGMALSADDNINASFWLSQDNICLKRKMVSGCMIAFKQLLVELHMHNFMWVYMRLHHHHQVVFINVTCYWLLLATMVHQYVNV